MGLQGDEIFLMSGLGGHQACECPSTPLNGNQGDEVGASNLPPSR